jgi:CO/xanthine dehydrogenase FAD-binding subunit
LRKHLIEIVNYVKADSLSQAYELNQKKTSIILGGMLWLKMNRRRVTTAIDLSALGLDTIEETDEEFRIGAMTTLRQLELHAGLNAYTQNAMRESVRHIVGVQFRNLATVGGSLFGRYGFSDVLTLFMALDAKVELYQGGIVPVETFASMKPDNDILVRVIVPKTERKTAYLSQRNTQTDFPVLTCCVSVGETVRCCIGARPMRAVCLTDAQGILKQGITQESAEAFGNYVKETVPTGSNLRGSKEYRAVLAGVLTKRALLQIAKMTYED